MDEQNKVFPDGVNDVHEAEEVRDLFHHLMEEEPGEDEASAESSEVVQETSAHEESVLRQAADVTSENAVVFEEAIPSDEKTVSPFDGLDRDELPEELPPLVLSQYEEEDDSDMSDEEFCYRFIVPASEDDEDGDTSDQSEGPRVRRNPFMAFWHALCDNVPLTDDKPREIVRKSVFWISWVVLVGALTYILYNVWWLPAFTKNMYSGVEEDYHPETVGTVDEDEYPEKMQLSFQTLYDRNDEIRGWLSYHATGYQDFLNIEYPVMYSGDNEKYLTIDFNGNKNKNGALFFDMRANLESPDDKNTSLIIYGHNMASGQMLAGLNKFIGNVNNARAASTLTMNTLFEDGQYKVFAVVITDESASDNYYFNARRTAFLDSEDFEQYIVSLRERSLFDYPVDVIAGDELLLLSTCTVPSSAKIENGRLTVIARKVREGETVSVDTAAIVKNSDVIMPYAWYIKQNMDVHSYYANSGLTTGESNTTTTPELSDENTVTFQEQTDITLDEEMNDTTAFPMENEGGLMTSHEETDTTVDEEMTTTTTLSTEEEDDEVTSAEETDTTADEEESTTTATTSETTTKTTKADETEAETTTEAPAKETTAEKTTKATVKETTKTKIMTTESKPMTVATTTTETTTEATTTETTTTEEITKETTAEETIATEQTTAPTGDLPAKETGDEESTESTEETDATVTEE